MTRFFGGILVLALFSAQTGQACADYIFTTIDVPGSAQTVATGINDAGQIVGYYNNHGFLLSNGVYTTLDAPGSVGTQAMGINNAGQVVGCYTGVGDAAVTHGFILSGGSYSPLDVPRSFGGNYPQISTSATGINESGVVVGTFVYPTSTKPPVSGAGVFLLSAGVYKDVSEPGGISGAGGINNAGQIVGYAGGHGFLLSGGIYTDFAVPGSILTSASGLNNTGQIVGTYEDHVGGPDHGFLLSGGSYTTIDMPGASMTDPNGINNLGEIVGVYFDAAGREHGFLATPAPVPEPFTLALLCIGAMGLLGWAWRQSLRIGCGSPTTGMQGPVARFQ
ncbi:MAG TPA: PEP-CTERM sorting domain-containing protein [Gemmataceae bacterium]|nr:PEP-CTERM sorting domain-containing protein [Gemmataceae bacterium]